MSDLVQFLLRPEHLALLRHAYVRWEDCEYGAPSIDCKRPYGNSYVLGDIAEILCISPNLNDPDDAFTIEERIFMEKLHRETQTALQIILKTGEMTPGVYRSSRYKNDWSRVEPLTT